MQQPRLQDLLIDLKCNNLGYEIFYWSLWWCKRSIGTTPKKKEKKTCCGARSPAHKASIQTRKSFAGNYNHEHFQALFWKHDSHFHATRNRYSPIFLSYVCVRACVCLCLCVRKCMGSACKGPVPWCNTWSSTFTLGPSASIMRSGGTFQKCIIKMVTMLDWRLHIKWRSKDMVVELLLYWMCFLTCQRPPPPLLLLLHQDNLVLVLSPMWVFILHNFSCVQHIF